MLWLAPNIGGRHPALFQPAGHYTLGNPELPSNHAKLFKFRRSMSTPRERKSGLSLSHYFECVYKGHWTLFQYITKND
jgi:hypothetical protein